MKTKQHLNNLSPAPTYVGANISKLQRAQAAVAIVERDYEKVFALSDKTISFSSTPIKYLKDGRIKVIVYADVECGKTISRKFYVTAQEIYNFYEDN